MDPNATYELWKEAVLRGDAYAAILAYEDLRTWLERGGFEPKAFAVPSIRAAFCSYNPRTARQALK